MIFSKFFEIIKNNNSFLLSSHVNSDGDCLCALLTVYWYIQSLGKEVHIYHGDTVPVKFSFLKNVGKIETKIEKDTFDVFIILDSSNPARLGWDTKKIFAPIIINIDHHRDNTNFGQCNIVDVSASATCQILYDMVTENNITYPPFVAETIYTGILTDTGGFQFTNTTGRVLSICADLVEKGADCAKIYKKIYASFTKPGLLLRTKIWSTLQFYCKDRISSMELSAKDFELSGADRGDIEGMSDLALTVEGVDVGLFIKYFDTYTHFSLRSKGTVDVGFIAQRISGGGGHTCAAGCTINLPVKAAKEKMIEIIKKEID